MIPNMLTSDAIVIEIRLRKRECLIFRLIPFIEFTQNWSVEPEIIVGIPNTATPNAPP